MNSVKPKLSKHFAALVPGKPQSVLLQAPRREQGHLMTALVPIILVAFIVGMLIKPGSGGLIAIAGILAVICGGAMAIGLVEEYRLSTKAWRATREWCAKQSTAARAFRARITRRTRYMKASAPGDTGQAHSFAGVSTLFTAMGIDVQARKIALAFGSHVEEIAMEQVLGWLAGPADPAEPTTQSDGRVFTIYLQTPKEQERMASSERHEIVITMRSTDDAQWLASALQQMLGKPNAGLRG